MVSTYAEMEFILFSHLFIIILNFVVVMAQDLQLIENAYTVTSKLRQYCILPLFVYQLCLMYSISPEITNAHLIGILIAFVVGLAASRFNRDLLKIFLFIYLCSLVYLCYLHSNYYGLNAGLTFAFAHFVITDRYTYLDFPAIDFYNYCICFYLLFCWKAIND